MALAARLVLAAVLAVSAVAKGRRGRGVAVDLVAFGVPERVAQAGWWALPVVEGAVAVLLVAVRSPWTAWVAVGLMGAFSVAVVAHLARGERAPCPCFGALSQGPVSGLTLVRNAVFLALGILATGG